MSLTGVAIEKRKVTYFVVFLLIVTGIGSFFSLGQLEDPVFTVKKAVIMTTYPGASPQEVEQEVTDRIELAIKEMPQLDYVESSSRAGLSQINVELKAIYWSDQIPQVWDELRRKIRIIEHTLPPGAGRPDVSDDFGDVYGFQLAVVGDGLSDAVMEEYAKDIKKELSPWLASVFVTAQNRGKGIGTALCHKIVSEALSRPAEGLHLIQAEAFSIILNTEIRTSFLQQIPGRRQNHGFAFQTE